MSCGRGDVLSINFCLVLIETGNFFYRYHESILLIFGFGLRKKGGPSNLPTTPSSSILLRNQRQGSKDGDQLQGSRLDSGGPSVSQGGDLPEWLKPEP